MALDQGADRALGDVYLADGRVISACMAARIRDAFDRGLTREQAGFAGSCYWMLNAWADHFGLQWQTRRRKVVDCADDVRLADGRVIRAHHAAGLRSAFDRGLTKWKAARETGTTGALYWIPDAWANYFGLRWPDHLNQPFADRDIPPIALVDVRAEDCLTLWQNVLLNEWNLAVAPKCEGYRLAAQREARAWFGSCGFYQVCALAGFDGSVVLERYKAKLAALGVM